MIDAAGTWRARRPVLGRRQLPRGAARARRGARGARRRVGLRVHMDIVALAADAGRARRRRSGAAPPGDDPLREPRRDHRDLHRAADHLQPRDPGAADRGGAARVARCSASWRRACGPSSPTRLRFPGTAAIRDEIARVVPALRAGSRTCATRATRCSTAGPLLCDGWEFPTADGRARFTPAADPRADRSRRPARARHPARQAVQLDGPGGRRRAHRRAARGGADQLRRRAPARDRRRATR